MKKVFISVGSNYKQETYIPLALIKLKQNLKNFIVSSCYVSKSRNIGNDYWNLVVSGDTSIFEYQSLKNFLKDIEIFCERTKNNLHQCSVDLDLLLMDNDFVEGKLPHPDLFKYKYVLVPLCEIAPTLQIPFKNETFLSYYKRNIKSLKIDVELIYSQFIVKKWL